MKPRTVFMGSPEFAVPALRALAGACPVVGVVTQPDRQAGRGRALSQPPVKTLALELGLPVIQPVRLRQPEAMQQLHDWEPELIVVAAFGQILRSEVLDLPPFGCLNVHASLLPRWRGAAPIQAAILHGDATTGITLMRMDPGIDTGPTLTQRALPILPEDTADSLSQRLADLGAELLLEALPAYLSGDLLPQPQDESAATYAPMLKKEDGELDFNLPAVDLERRVRAFSPWPGAYTTWNGQLLKIRRTAVTSASQLSHLPQPGSRLIHHGLPAIAVADGLLLLHEVQPAGKKPMPGKAFLQGARNWV
ncbi:MAG: methionyl-tRNA formyltransferase [Chloroflexota bacterium]